MNRTDYEKIEHASRARKRIGKTAIYFLLTVWALMVLFPFYWMMLTSVKSYSSYNSEYIPKFFTLSPTFQNYIDAFTTVPLARYFTNTIIFTLATTGLMLLVIIPAAFAFSRLDFKGKNLVIINRDKINVRVGQNTLVINEKIGQVFTELAKLQGIEL